MQDTNSVDLKFSFPTPISGKETVDMEFVNPTAARVASMIARELVQSIAERVKSELDDNLGDSIPAGELYVSAKYSGPEAMAFINGISIVSGKEPPANG